MSKALYTKYRPQNFEEVIGQDITVKILKRSSESESMNHAYLFYGIRGTGKTTLARLFAKTLNCENKTEGNACNVCDSCKSINNSAQIDVIEMDAASNNGVDEIRDLTEKANYATTSSKYKIYIIDEVHMLTKSAFNALLKTLEEPPKNTIFLLATTEINKIPDTILSRTVILNLQLVNKDEIVEQLANILEKENKDYELGALDYIATLSEGSVRDAISYLQTILLYSDVVNQQTVVEALGVVNVEELRKALVAGTNITSLINDSTNGRRLMIVLMDLLIELISKGNTKYKKLLSKLTDGFISIKDPMLLNRFIKAVFTEQGADEVQIESIPTYDVSENIAATIEQTIETKVEEMMEEISIQDILRKQVEEGTREARIMLGEQVTEEFTKEETVEQPIEEIEETPSETIQEEVFNNSEVEHVEQTEEQTVQQVGLFEETKEQTIETQQSEVEEDEEQTEEQMLEEITKEIEALEVPAKEAAEPEVAYIPFKFDSKDYVYTMLNGLESKLSSANNGWLRLRTAGTITTLNEEEERVAALLQETEVLIASENAVIVGVTDEYINDELKKVVNSSAMKTLQEKLFNYNFIVMPVNSDNWEKLTSVAKQVMESGIDIEFSLSLKSFFRKEKDNEAELARNLFGDALEG